MSDYKIAKIQSNSLVRRHLPRGWRLIYSPRARNFLGLCNYDTKTISLRQPPDTAEYAMIFLHEVGHARCHGPVYHGADWPRPYVREYEAEKYALTVARQEGIRVPRKHLHNMKANVASYFPSRGRIDRKIQKWARS